MCGESDGSKKKEADIPAGYTDTLSSKPPQSAMAEEQKLVAIKLAVLWVESRVSRTSANGKRIQRIDWLLWVDRRQSA